MKRFFRRMIVLVLAIAMMLPANAFAAETTISWSTQSNVNKIVSYADQLRNSSNSNSTTSGFVWDTEKKTYSWSYFNGLMMDAFMDLGGNTNKNFVDTFYNANIASDGSIVNLTQGKVSSGALDFCEPLRATFDLLRTSSNAAKYKSAIQKWYRYLEDQIVYANCGGNYAHKQDNTTTVSSSWAEYPIALDGLYMAQPFLMETANAIDAGILSIKDKNGRTVTSSSIYNAVYNRFVWIYNNLYNSSTGLYDHGYNPSTRRTNGVTWSRSVGWYVMALVDVIDMMPAGSMKNDLAGELPRIFDGLLRYQDASGLWYNVTAYNSSLWGKNQNLLETSGSSMFAYAMVKATQKGFVTDPKYYNAAIRAFNGVVNTKLKGSQGSYSVVDTYKSSGASTDPSYYCNNSYTTNEAKGIGSLIMLAALLKNNSTAGSEDALISGTPMQTVTTVTYEKATTIDTTSEYLMASGGSGSVKILGHTGYSIYNSDATVSNNLLTSSFSHADGNDANYLWKFSAANTATNQTSSPVISNATPLSSNEPIAYIQNWDRNQIGAWGGGITVVNKGGYFTMKQWDNYIDAGSTQNATSAKNIYLFKKVVTTSQVPTVHEHTYELVEEQAGNCKVKGSKLYRCSSCQEEKTEETVLGDHNFEIVSETSGNCVTKGLQTSKCSICGETKTAETVYGDHSPKFDHSVDGDCSHKGLDVFVCQLCGNETSKETVYGDHNFTYTKDVNGDCSHKGYKLYTCSICQATKQEETSLGDHNFTLTREVNGDCVSKGYKLYTCSICKATKQEETSLGDHNFTFTREVNGDCVTKGYKLYTCFLCGLTKQEETSLGDHSFEIVSETNGDCVTKGLQTSKCSICDETKTAETVYGDHSPKFDHSVDGDCSHKGLDLFVCELCGNETSKETVYGDHSFTYTKDVNGDCSHKGYKLYTCSICKATKQEETSLGDHSFEIVSETSGNCVTKGLQTSKCSICGETKTTETVYGAHSPKLDHSVTGDCSHKGLDVFVCELCGNETSKETVYGDHNFTYTKDVNGDCSHKGYKLYTCSICKATKQEETVLGDHSFEIVSETSGNCVTKGLQTSKCSICDETKTAETVYGDHSPKLDHSVTGDCSHKGLDVFVCELCGNETSKETVYGDHNFTYTKDVNGDCSHKGYKLYTCSICKATKQEETILGDHSFSYTKDVPGTCTTKGYKLYTCSICQATRQEETVLGDHSYQLIADVPAVNGNNGYKRYQCSYCKDTYDEIVVPQYEIIEETTTTVSYELATSITAGGKYIIASGNNGNVTIIGNNGSAFKSTAYASNRKIDMTGKNLGQFLWTFASSSSGKIQNNGLFVKTSSASQFNSTGEQMSITNLGGGAYQIKKTTGAGVTSYLNPNNLTSKTSAPTTVYLYKEVVTTTINRYEVHIEYETTEKTVYERATTIEPGSEYLMASGSNGNVRILGHTGYSIYNSDATVSNNLLTSSFSHASGNDANYLWKFSTPNTGVNQTSTPVISNATSLSSNDPVAYIQNWDRNQIGAWGGGITVVNKGGYFTMQQWDNYIDAGSTQNSTSPKNIYLFKKTVKTETKEKRVLVKI